MSAQPTATECSICSEKYDTGSDPEVAVTLTCGHTFGSMCIAKWLHVPGRTNKCPICRAQLFSQTSEMPEPQALDDFLEQTLNARARSDENFVDRMAAQANNGRPNLIINRYTGQVIELPLVDLIPGTQPVIFDFDPHAVRGEESGSNLATEEEFQGIMEQLRRTRFSMQQVVGENNTFSLALPVPGPGPSEESNHARNNTSTTDTDRQAILDQVMGPTFSPGPINDETNTGRTI